MRGLVLLKIAENRQFPHLRPLSEFRVTPSVEMGGSALLPEKYGAELDSYSQYRTKAEPETRLADPAPITAVSATAKSILVFRGFTFGHPQYIRLLPRATGRSRFGPPKPGP